MILLLSLLFPFFLNAQIVSDFDIERTRLILSDSTVLNASKIDSVENPHLKLVLREILLNNLIEKNNIKEIKRNFNVFDNDFEQAVKRCFSGREDTSLISYFIKLGYNLESRDYDRKKIRDWSAEDKLTYINKYPQDNYSKELYSLIKKSADKNKLKGFFIANMKGGSSSELFSEEDSTESYSFLSSLVNDDTLKVKSMINKNLPLFKMTDKKFKIKYSVFVDESLRDGNIFYFLGRNSEDRKEYNDALKFYMKAKDEEAVLRVIACLKNINRKDEYADSILLCYDAVSPAFIYHRAKKLLLLGRKKESDSLFNGIAEMFPMNLYSIRAALHLGKKLETQFEKSDLETNILILHDIFKNANYENYFDRFIFRIVSGGAMGYKNAAFLMDSINEHNLAIYFAEQHVIKDKFSSDLIDILYPAPYIEIFRRAAKEQKIDVCLLLAVAREESSFNPKAFSSAGAMGIMQLMDFTYGEYYKDKDYYNLEKNIYAGAKHLSSYLKDFPNNPSEGIMSYNAGKGNVKKWKRIYADWELFLESVPFIETKNYVKKVLRSYYIYKFVIKVS